ncbi:hypothetical protein DFJ73DRAFT_822043 [Zopfochytrium polystomum]|nr:hypothetical protein DFJ73DRAFT_822043 [Zopfochytrium polystomum]
MSAAMEGMQLMAAGEKAANKTSFFGKKTPDWEVARMNYESAASAFKSSRAYDHAVEAHIKCANAYKNLDTIYLAARQLEQAAILMIQQLKKPVEGAHLYREASNYFVAHGSGDKGADVLEKAAKAVETADPALAGELYLEAVSTYESEDKLRQSVDTFTRAISFFLRVKRFAEAADLSQRLATIHAKTNNRQGFNRQGLATAVIALSTGDNVDARKRIMAAFAG